MLLKLAVFVCAPLTVVGLATITPEDANSAPPNLYVTKAGSNTVSRFEVASDGLLDAQLDTGTGSSPHGVVVSPDGRNLYVANSTSNTVSWFPVNPDGTLGGQTTYPTQNGPLSVVVSPDGRNLYVANSTSNTVSWFPVNPDGTLGGQTTYPTQNGPLSVVVSPDGRNLYVANSTSNTVSRFPVNPDGTLGGQTTYPTQNGPLSVVVSPDGRNLYVANSTSNTVSRFSVSSGGILSDRKDTVTGRKPIGIAISPDGRNLYIANFDFSDISRFSVSSDGTLSGRVDAATGGGSNSVVVSPDGRNLYTANFLIQNVSRISVMLDGTLSTTRQDTLTGENSYPFAIAFSPVVDLVARFVSVVSDGGSVSFDGSSSSVSGANVVGYHWDFGDGTAGVDSSGPRVDHVFHTPGTYTVRLTVVDDSGCPAGKMIFTGQAALCNRLADKPTTTQTITISQPKTTTGQIVRTLTTVVSQCVVPSVTKLSLNQAKKKLVAAKCQAGKVSKPKTRRHKRGYKLLVVSQSRKQGMTLPVKTKIGLKLGWVKPKKQR